MPDRTGLISQNTVETTCGLHYATTDMYVAMLDRQDIGLIQSYRLADHPGWATTIEGSGLAFPSSAGDSGLATLCVRTR